MGAERIEAGACFGFWWDFAAFELVVKCCVEGLFVVEARVERIGDVDGSMDCGLGSGGGADVGAVVMAAAGAGELGSVCASCVSSSVSAEDLTIFS